jgi:hypothetical protein
MGGDKVPFKSKAIKEFLEEVAENELAHVRFYRKTLGGSAVDRPAIDFDAGFSAAAKGAGLGSNFNAFENEMNFLLGGMLFEDVGVTAYAGAATALKEREHLEAAAEFSQWRLITWVWRARSFTRWERRRGRPPTRFPMPGTNSTDPGTRIKVSAWMVRPISSRQILTGSLSGATPQEVLHIVYLTEQSGVGKGGFYGTLKTT